MGLFSSSYKTTVGTSVVRAVKDELIVSSVKTGLINALFSDSNDLVGNVLESMVSGVGVRAERMHAYGKSGYVHGLPSSTVLSSAKGQDVVKAVIAAEVGGSIDISYYHYGPLNALHVGWMNLVSLYGYDSTTNELDVLSTAHGFPAYLVDMVVVVQDATLDERGNGSLDQWGTPPNTGFTPLRAARLGSLAQHTPFSVEPGVANDFLRVSYVWVESIPTTIGTVTITKKVFHKEEIEIPVVGYTTEGSYFQVKYVAAGKDGYWLYDESSGLYPTISAVFDTARTTLGSFFPIAYFRLGRADLSADKTTAEYKSMVKLTKYVGMNYPDIAEAINSNPDIENVEQAMLLMAVPAKTSTQVEMRYLFDFFSKLYVESGGIGIGLGGSIGDIGILETGSYQEVAAAKMLNATTPKISLVIEDAKFKMSVACQALFKKSKVGVVAAVGAYVSSFGTTLVAYNYTVPGYTNDNELVAVPRTGHQEIDFFTYQYQVSEDVYEEVRVYDLKVTYFQMGTYTTIGDGESNIVLIPLDHAITVKYAIPDRDLLYKRAMHYVFNSLVVTEVKWYQSMFFEFLMLVVAVYFMVTTGLDATALIGKVVAGTVTIEAAVMMAAKALMYQIRDMLALKLFINSVGAEAAFVIAIAAAMVGMFKVVNAGSVAGAPWAKELLALSSGLSSEVNKFISQGMAAVNNDFNELNSLAESNSELLKSANALLESNSTLSPFVIFGESCDDFYNRTVHAGNVGCTGLDSISYYVETALTLPKLSETT